MTDQTEREREALKRWPIVTTSMGVEAEREWRRRAFIAGAEWADDHRATTPHVVTTKEGLRDLPHGTAFEDSDERMGVLLWPTSHPDVMWVGRSGLGGIGSVTFPVTVLTDAPAPVDREARVEAGARGICALRGVDPDGGGLGGFPAWKAYTADARAVLDGIEGVSRG